MRLSFLGASGTVTGSKYLVESGGRRVLVDCGLYQGLKDLRMRNWTPLPVRPRDIDAVVLTHAHLDHTGYLPVLVRDGFAGRIFCSAPTRDLSAILLRDAGHLQEEDAAFANRRGFSRHRPALPLFTSEDAARALDRFTVIDWGTAHGFGGGLVTRLSRAGHMLGAAAVHMSDGRTSVLFSGDLGRPEDPFLLAPARPPAANHVVIESTYGDRLHPEGDPLARIGEVIRRTVDRGGVVVIPAFAVGRAQLVLHYLATLKRRGELPDVPLFVNSPMAVNATEIFCKHRSEHRLDEEACRAMCGVAEMVNSVAESKALNARRGPMVIVSASGMLAGGRVLHHIEAFGTDRNSTILLAGYQAVGTRGRALLDGARTIRIHGHVVDVAAEVVALPELSGHADANEIISWLRTMEPGPRRVFVTHGEPAPAAALARRIQTELGWPSHVPAYREHADLAGGDGAAERLGPSEP